MSEHQPTAPATSSAPVTPSEGMGVLHLFCKPTPMFDPESVVAAVKAAEAAGTQVVTVAMLGHKCDMAVMAVHQNMRELRALQTGLQRAGLDVVDSYVSITEVSEYAKGMPAEMQRPRLYPSIPPEGDFPAWCFYPMSKKRESHANWFTLPYDDRRELMNDHGKSGRTFAGRIAQYITGSTGLDDFEWGVTLFGGHPDDLKDVVYTMRFDRASALYGEFGAFYVGMVTPVDELVHAI
jgi:hydrogen peroxide-dependent heme synthase